MTLFKVFDRERNLVSWNYYSKIDLLAYSFIGGAGAHSEMELEVMRKYPNSGDDLVGRLGLQQGIILNLVGIEINRSSLSR